ncbi:MAG: hypothetical protein ACKPCO_00815, partial [Actinomycetota bacterium]
DQVMLQPGAGVSITLSGQAATTAVSVTSTEPVVVQRSVSRGAKQPINGSAPLIAVSDACAPTGAC